MEPTKEELAFIKKLQKLMDKAPKTLWFFSGDSCGLHVMKYKGFTSKGHGIRAVHPLNLDYSTTERGGGMDQAYCIGTIKGPEFEGGDW